MKVIDLCSLRAQPVALVSWGRTLEMTTVGSSDICDWLQVAQTKKPKFDGVTQTRKYNLLLTRAAELHLLEGSTEIKVWRFAFVDLLNICQPTSQ